MYLVKRILSKKQILLQENMLKLNEKRVKRKYQLPQIKNNLEIHNKIEFN